MGEGGGAGWWWGKAGNGRPGRNGKFRIPEPPDSSPSLTLTVPSETPDLCA